MQKENKFFFSFPIESTFDRQVKGTNKRAKKQIYLGKFDENQRKQPFFDMRQKYDC